jgi:hypothetical protein
MVVSKNRLVCEIIIRAIADSTGIPDGETASATSDFGEGLRFLRRMGANRANLANKYKKELQKELFAKFVLFASYSP